MRLKTKSEATEKKGEEKKHLAAGEAVKEAAGEGEE